MLQNTNANPAALDTVVELAARSLGVEVELVPSNGFESESDRLECSITPAGGDSIVRYTLGSPHRGIELQAIIESPPNEWIKRLVATTGELIRCHLAMHSQDQHLEAYASQIGHDFEELAWTRELARQIQKADIRESLPTFIQTIFPSLQQTIRAEQLFLIRFQSPIWQGDPFPSEEDLEVTAIGEGNISQAQVIRLVQEHSRRPDRRPYVANYSCSEQVTGLEHLIIVSIDSRLKEFGWIVACNRTASPFQLPTTHETVVDSTQQEFGTFEADLMQSAASFLASHSHNNLLFAEQKHLLVGVISAMANAIDAKDQYTRGHSHRVAAISRRLAEQLGLEASSCNEIYLSGLLHDVGKIGVPEDVLKCPGELSDEETQILRRHPVIGFYVLEKLDPISYVLPGVLHHHESFDGTGYPDGLSGTDIPLIARIIAVADAFDAMTSDRPYRHGMSTQEALEILAHNAGPQWDEQVLTALFECADDVIRICNSDSFTDLMEFDASSQIASAVGAVLCERRPEH